VNRARLPLGLCVLNEGVDEAPIAPYDCGPLLDGPDIPGADLTVQHIQYDSPVGHIHFVDRFVSGHLIARERRHGAEQANLT
jgi:hypothetical protein